MPTVVQTFLDMARFLNAMLTSSNDAAKADWELIASTSIHGITGRQGGQYVKSTLIKKKEKCDTSKPISKEAVPIVDKLLEVIVSMTFVFPVATYVSPQILEELLFAARSGGNNEPVPGYRVRVLDLISELETVSQKARLISNSPGSSSKGFNKAKDNGKTSSSAARNAMENAKVRGYRLWIGNT